MKVTKTMLVAEAKRVFGADAAVAVDLRTDDGCWVCSAKDVVGARLVVRRIAKEAARRRLYDALRRLAPREGGE